MAFRVAAALVTCVFPLASCSAEEAALEPELQAVVDEAEAWLASSSLSDLTQEDVDRLGTVMCELANQEDDFMLRAMSELAEEVPGLDSVSMAKGVGALAAVHCPETVLQLGRQAAAEWETLEQES